MCKVETTWAVGPFDCVTNWSAVRSITGGGKVASTENWLCKATGLRDDTQMPCLAASCKKASERPETSGVLGKACTAVGNTGKVCKFCTALGGAGKVMTWAETGAESAGTGLTVRAAETTLARDW